MGPILSRSDVTRPLPAFPTERAQQRTRPWDGLASPKDERGTERLLQWQERDPARTARDAYDGGGRGLCTEPGIA